MRKAILVVLVAVALSGCRDKIPHCVRRCVAQLAFGESVTPVCETLCRDSADPGRAFHGAE